MKVAAVALLACTLSATACVPRPAAIEMPEYIGEARMAPDGTIILDLMALGDRGEIGHGRLTYVPDHPQYRDVLEHLGGLAPGEIKPVRPWPDPPPPPR